LKISDFGVISLATTSALPEIKTPPNPGRRFYVGCGTVGYADTRIPEWIGTKVIDFKKRHRLMDGLLAPNRGINHSAARL
jgi:hypothetical protein